MLVQVLSNDSIILFSQTLPFSDQRIVRHFQGNEACHHQNRQDLEPADGIAEDDPCQKCRDHGFEEEQIVGS